MIETVIEATDADRWRETLVPFERVDVCQLPHYHLTYSARVPASKPLLWSLRDGDFQFAYPFLLTPIMLTGPDGDVATTQYSDISSIYGYSGPLCVGATEVNLGNAWARFDAWARERDVIAEFTRFSVYADNTPFAHPDALVERNRPVAIFRLENDEDRTLAALGPKTRNMIRKAAKAGLEARELDLERGEIAFRVLYEETMERNDAPGFFRYDDQYYRQLLAAPAGAVRLFGVFAGENMVAAAMALVHGTGALYHLGASRSEYSRLGAGNLSMYEMARRLGRDGVRFLNLGGGRTTADDDPLFRFKKNNGSDVADFFIGKRVVSRSGYDDVVAQWTAINGREPDSPQLIFYR